MFKYKTLGGRPPSKIFFYPQNTEPNPKMIHGESLKEGFSLSSYERYSEKGKKRVEERLKS